MPDILLENVGKKYDSIQALSEFSMEVTKGELHGLIGPDGAGKTTIMRILCSLLKADSGKMLVRGLDPNTQSSSIRKFLGYMPQRFSLYQDLSVEQNIRFFAELFEVDESEIIPRMEELYSFSRLGKFKKRKAGALSGGMKQKLALTCNLVHTPDIMILDEPTFGVDPLSRQEFWDILHELNEKGITILVSTPYMEEAEQCSRITLIEHGKAIAVGKPREIIEAYPHPIYRLTGRNIRNLRQFFSQHSNVCSLQLFGDSLHISFCVEPTSVQWDEFKQGSDHNLLSYDKISASIEDVFLNLGAEK